MRLAFSLFGFFSVMPLNLPVQKLDIGVHLLDTEAGNSIASPWHIGGALDEEKTVACSPSGAWSGITPHDGVKSWHVIDSGTQLATAPLSREVVQRCGLDISC